MVQGLIAQAHLVSLVAPKMKFKYFAEKYLMAHNVGQMFYFDERPGMNSAKSLRNRRQLKQHWQLMVSIMPPC